MACSIQQRITLPMAWSLGLTLLLLPRHISAASPASPPGRIILVTETDEDGGRYSIPSSAIAADVNSTLELRLDKTSLRAAIGEHLSAPALGELNRELGFLQRILEQQASALRSLSEAQQLIADYLRHPTEETLEALKKPLSDSARPVRDLLVHLGEVPELEDLTDEQLAIPAFQDEAVYRAAARRLRELEDRLESLAREAGVYVQFGAFLKTNGGLRSVHLGPFDDYPEVEPHYVKRWNLAFPDDISKYASLAAEINKSQQNLLPTLGRALVDGLKGSTKTGNCVRDLANRVRDARSKSAQLPEQLTHELTAIEKAVRDFESKMKEVQEKYLRGGAATSLSSESFLRETATDLAAIAKALVNLKSSLERHWKSLQELVNNGGQEAKSNLQWLLEALNSCIDMAAAEALVWEDRATVRFGQVLAEGATELFDLVRRFDLESLPSTHQLSLASMGVREPGDTLILRVRAGTGLQTPQILETVEIPLFQVLWHADVKGGLIFADPQGASQVAKRFQAAPAYSVLLRKQSRTRLTYNRVVNVGIGVNVAALDFNHDDSLELGLGLVVSGFADLIQVGYGFNVTEDKRYWFLGLRLPLPSASVRF